MTLRLSDIWGFLSGLATLEPKPWYQFTIVVVCGSVAVSIVEAALAGRVTSRYGRYSDAIKNSDNILFTPIPPKQFWVLMEVPNLIMGCYTLSYSKVPFSDLRMIIVTLFMFHYLLRTSVFALLLRGGSPAPLHVLLMGSLFTMFNGFLQSGYHLQHVHYEQGEALSLRVVVGIIVFFAGLVSNHYCDSILRNLRSDPNDKNHYVPRGFLFEYVSGANFLAESIEWLGYAIASNSIAGWGFFISTAVNTGGRALDHHNWYLNKFKEDYPKDRKAFIPFVL